MLKRLVIPLQDCLSEEYNDEECVKQARAGVCEAVRSTEINRNCSTKNQQMYNRKVRRCDRLANVKINYSALGGPKEEDDTTESSDFKEGDTSESSDFELQVKPNLRNEIIKYIKKKKKSKEDDTSESSDFQLQVVPNMKKTFIKKLKKKKSTKVKEDTIERKRKLAKQHQKFFRGKMRRCDRLANITTDYSERRESLEEDSTHESSDLEEPAEGIDPKILKRLEIILHDCMALNSDVHKSPGSAKQKEDIHKDKEEDDMNESSDLDENVFNV